MVEFNANFFPNGLRCKEKSFVNLVKIQKEYENIIFISFTYSIIFSKLEIKEQRLNGVCTNRFTNRFSGKRCSD